VRNRHLTEQTGTGTSRLRGL